jgi:hypothetical protein
MGNALHVDLVQFTTLHSVCGVSWLATCGWVTNTIVGAGKQGAIILGTGGDNSNGAVGNFYEVCPPDLLCKLFYKTVQSVPVTRPDLT